MSAIKSIGNLFSRMVNAITWDNIVMAFRFLNVTDAQSGYLAPPKVLVWFISIGICYAMFRIGDEEMDLAVFAGAIGTLVAAFAAAYKLALDGDKEDEEEYQRRMREKHGSDYEPPAVLLAVPKPKKATKLKEPKADV